MKTHRLKFLPLLVAALPALAAVRPEQAFIDYAKGIAKDHRNAQRDEAPACVGACGYLEAIAADAERLGLDRKAVARIWCQYALIAKDIFRDDLLLKGYKAMMEADPTLVETDSLARTRLRTHVRSLEDARRFPRPESEIRFGQTLESMGVRKGRTVALKDYWNPTNVTAAFQRLVDDPEVTTIVLDRMPTPWYVDAVFFDEKVDGKRVLFKSGCEVLRCPDRCIDVLGKHVRDGLFEILGAKNLIFESDAARPEDVHIGFYRDYEERARRCKKEGPSAFSIRCGRSSIHEARNIVIRNLRIADTEEDGLFTGSNWAQPEDIFVENVVFESNFRQGTSPCSYYSIYFKGCKFINTAGGPPGAGVDVEPWAHYLCTANAYFFDCEFANNRGGAIGLPIVSQDAFLCHVKRCRFRPTYHAQIDVCSRPSRYFAAGGRPPAHILVEDCAFESTGDTILLNPVPIFDMTVRNCTIRDMRSNYVRKRKPGAAAPLAVRLNRDFGTPDIPAALRPRIVFENVKVTGFEDSPFIAVRDELGKMNLNGIFSGSADFNGKTVSLDDFAYDAPDINEPRTRFADLKRLQRPERIPAADGKMPESNAELCAHGAWWLKQPCHSYYFWADKGREVSFTLTVSYPRYVKAFPTNTMSVVSASGRTTEIGAVANGSHRLVFRSPETGWHRFSPGPVLATQSINSGVKWAVTDVQGAHFAWQADTVSDSYAKFLLRDLKKPYTGYFEVPAGGKPCRLRVSAGGFELRDPAGNLVEEVAESDYSGRHVFTITPSTKAAEIWSFTTRGDAKGGYWMRALRFYEPLNGIWADTPEDLPCRFGTHYVPKKKAGADDAARTFSRLNRAKVPQTCLVRLDAAIAARRKFGAAGEYAALAKETELKIAKLRAQGADDGAQREIDDLNGELAKLRRIVRMEGLAAKESDDVREAVAFCQEFAPALVGALGKRSARVESDIDVALEPFGLSWPKGVLEYQNEADLPPLCEAILEKLK